MKQNGAVSGTLERTLVKWPSKNFRYRAQKLSIFFHNIFGVKNKTQDFECSPIDIQTCQFGNHSSSSLTFTAYVIIIKIKRIIIIEPIWPSIDMI
jgi:hypothetical protein